MLAVRGLEYIHRELVQVSKTATSYCAEGGFEPLDFYIPTGLKPAPRTLQAHPRSLHNS